MSTCTFPNGQWRCLDCGQSFRNNLESYLHLNHRQQWWCFEHEAFEGKVAIEREGE
jgi:hypothetical protein